MTVDLNLQTFSSKVKYSLIRLLIFVLAAALILTGAVPSFADKKTDKGTEKIKASAEIDWTDAPAIEGTSAIIIDGGSGDILYEKNAYERRDPASITKMLTCLVVLETMDLDQEVTVPFDADKTGHNMASKKGEVLTVEQLLYAMMVYSANDAAVVLAIASGGSVDNFCDLMNERAARCGAKSTTFTNPNGLNTYGQGNHKTTAYDLAMIAKEALKNPVFRKLVSTSKYTIPATNMSEKRVFTSTNPCLYASKKTVEINGTERPFKYKGTTGVKTGYTSASGQCFCGSAKHGETELIAVSLNSATGESRFTDVMQLWDYGFSEYYTYNGARAKEPVTEEKVRRGEKSKISLGVAEDFDITLNKGYSSKDITTEIKLKDEKITAPVKKGQAMGTLTAYNKAGDAVGRTQLLAMEGVQKGGPLSYIGIADEDIPFFIISLISAIIILIIIRMVYVQIRRRKRIRKRSRIQRSARRKEWDKEKDPFR